MHNKTKNISWAILHDGLCQINVPMKYCWRKYLHLLMKTMISFSLTCVLNWIWLPVVLLTKTYFRLNASVTWTDLNLIPEVKIYFQQLAKVESAIDQAGSRSWLERNTKSCYIVCYNAKLCKKNDGGLMIPNGVTGSFPALFKVMTCCCTKLLPKPILSNHQYGLYRMQFNKTSSKIKLFWLMKMYVWFVEWLSYILSQPQFVKSSPSSAA